MSILHLDDLSIGPGDALILIDVQNDFLPGGSLPAPGGDEVVPLLSRVARRFEAAALPIFATRCWHPPDHCSFRAQGGPWPPHAVQGTSGARFARGLDLPASTTVISKATSKDRDAYSDFDSTDLEQRLHAAGTQRLFIGGLATDYCVLYTVGDALDRGFAVSLLVDAVRAIDASPGDGERALRSMLQRGALAVAIGAQPPATGAAP